MRAGGRSDAQTFSLNTISAVKAQGEFASWRMRGAFTAFVLREFLARLMFDAREPVFLIMNSRPVHNAWLVQASVKRRKDD